MSLHTYCRPIVPCVSSVAVFLSHRTAVSLAIFSVGLFLKAKILVGRTVYQSTSIPRILLPKDKPGHMIYFYRFHLLFLSTQK